MFLFLMKKNKIIIAIIAAFIFIVCSLNFNDYFSKNNAITQDNLQNQDKKELIVGITIAARPIAYYENNNLSGFYFIIL